MCRGVRGVCEINRKKYQEKRGERVSKEERKEETGEKETTERER